MYVSLLTEAPSQEGIERFRASSGEGEEHRIVGRDVYLFLRHGFRNSKLANGLSKLGIPGTVRNWKTINKSAEMEK